jgi:hypothetical protein
VKHNADRRMKIALWVRTLLVVVAPLAAACTGARTETVAPPVVPGQPTPTPIPTPVPSLIAVLVGAGDIADCDNDGGAHAEATAKLLDNIAGAVFTAGDDAYFNGSAEEFANCYGPRWGRHRSRTFPSPGNHEYQSPGAIPYFDYFGDRAGVRGAGFYSYTLGNWHIVSLNSNVSVSQGSDQYVWLLDDLETNKRSATAKCTLAYWHHPLFTSGPSAGTNALMRDFWSLLYQYGVDVVINGHDHLYERFAPQDVNGRRDAFGIQEFVVGTGGAPLYDFGATAQNSQFKMKAYGVLRLTLRDVGYDSVFIDAATGAQFDVNLNVLCH